MKRGGPLKRKAPLRAKGGFARADALAPERRSEIASAAAAARWAKPREPVRAVMATRLDQQHSAPIAKESYFHSEAWRRAVASIPCVLCGKHNETQCAHRNEGKAGGKKLMDDCWTAALCTTCHSGIDQGKEFDREARRERMDKAILLTLRELARQGKVRVA